MEPLFENDWGLFQEDEDDKRNGFYTFAKWYKNNDVISIVFRKYS